MADPAALPSRSDDSVGGHRFRLLWAGQAVSLLGDGAALIALPLLVLQLTDSAVATALVVAARTAAYLVVGLFTGPLMMRWDVRRTMIACDLVRALAFVVLVVAVGAGAGAWAVLVLSFVAACAGVFFETALAVAVQDVLGPGDLVAGNARLEGTAQLGLMLAPAVAGAAISVLDVRVFVLANAASFLVSALTLVALRLRPNTVLTDTGSRGRLRRTLSDLREGLSYIRAHTLIRRLVSLQVVINLAVASETLVIYFARTVLGASPSQVGLVVAAAGLGGVLGAAAAASFARRYPAEPLIGWAVIAIGLSLLACALSSEAWQLGAANAALGMFSVFATVHIRALRQRVVERNILARVTANARTLALAAYPAGAAAYGALAEIRDDGARWAFGVAAAMSIGSAAFAYAGLLRPSAAPRTDERTAGHGE